MADEFGNIMHYEIANCYYICGTRIPLCADEDTGECMGSMTIDVMVVNCPECRARIKAAWKNEDEGGEDFEKQMRRKWGTERKEGEE